MSEAAKKSNGQPSKPESGLTEDERQGLVDMKAELEGEKSRLNSSIESLQSDIEILSQEVEETKDKISEIESDMGTIEKLNMFSREEEYEVALNNYESSREKLLEKRKDLSDFQEEVLSVDKDIENTVDLIEGRAVEEGWLANVKRQLAEFRDMAKWERVADTIEGVIPAILNLMAAFVIKTLIMPLIFLALFLRGFKYIWGVDPRKWVKDEYQKIQKVE